MTTIKNCLWCANPCDYYFKTIIPQAAAMFGESASDLRQATAWGCEEYKI